MFSPFTNSLHIFFCNWHLPEFPKNFLKKWVSRRRNFPRFRGRLVSSSEWPVHVKLREVVAADLLKRAEPGAAIVAYSEWRSKFSEGQYLTLLLGLAVTHFRLGDWWLGKDIMILSPCL